MHQSQKPCTVQLKCNKCGAAFYVDNYNVDEQCVICDEGELKYVNVPRNDTEHYEQVQKFLGKFKLPNLR